jgi:hypothetical protein
MADSLAGGSGGLGRCGGSGGLGGLGGRSGAGGRRVLGRVLVAGGPVPVHHGDQRERHVAEPVEDPEQGGLVDDGPFDEGGAVGPTGERESVSQSLQRASRWPRTRISTRPGAGVPSRCCSGGAHVAFSLPGSFDGRSC